MMHQVGSKTGKLLLEAGNEKRVYYRSLFYSVYSWKILFIYLFLFSYLNVFCKIMILIIFWQNSYVFIIILKNKLFQKLSLQNTISRFEILA